MSVEDNEKNIGIDNLKAKILEQKQKFAQHRDDSVQEFSWQEVAKTTKEKNINSTNNIWSPQITKHIDFHAKNLENGNYAGENLENANFSVAKLKNINFAGANLAGVDFSGADLTGANFEGADLTGANLSGAKLTGANLRKAKLQNVTLTNADLTDAVFLGIDIDNLTLEDLQELVEYLATYYPHKLNLANFDLKLLDLKKIDLSRVSLRGVDFTGVDFTGVNIFDLDLSECIITPEQIAQAIGRTPSPEELKKILAPKPKKPNRKFYIDLTDFFFDNGKPAGVWNTHLDKTVTFEQLFSAAKRFTNAFQKDEIQRIKNEIKKENDNQKSSNDDLRRIIEENKRNTLEEKKKESQAILSALTTEKAPEPKPQTPHIDKRILHQRSDFSRD